MFCPNCGTENDEAATTCKKCGFNLKGAAAPKFKGTMLMMNSPQPGLPRPPGAPAPGPAAAPPPAPAPAPAAPAMPGPGPGAGARPMLKGTMLGVAPPAMGGHAPPPAGPAPMPAGHQGGFGMAPTPAQPFNAQPPPMAPPPAAPPGVNPLGGTMVADPAGMGFNPYGAGGYGAPPAAPGHAPHDHGAPPAQGAPPAHGGPQAGGYGGPPPGGGYGPPPGGAPGFPPPAGSPGFPPPGGGYGPPPGQGPGGFGPPPGHGGGFNPPGQHGGGFGPPPGGYGGPQPGYGSPPQQAYGGPTPGGMPSGGAPIVAASAGGRPLGKTRNPVMTLVFSAICFVYAFIQMWQMANELKAFRGKDDINPIFFFIPILNLIQFWTLAPKLLEAKQMAGVPNPSVQHPVLYLFFGFYFWPADLNEIWQAAGGGQAR